MARYDPKWALRKSSQIISISVRGHNVQERERFYHPVVRERRVRQETKIEEVGLKKNPKAFQDDYIKCFSKTVDYSL